MMNSPFQAIQKFTVFTVFLHLIQAQPATTIECIIGSKPNIVSFSSLVTYQGTVHSFNPRHSTYVGNYVNFTFKSIDVLLKNTFISFNSDSIISINLNNKQIRRIDEGAFNGLFCLHFLVLSGNNISNMSENTFEGLGNLRQLELSENLLEFVDGLVFRHLVNLETLNLSRNKIKTISDLAFANLTKLKVLDLSFNKLRKISPISTLPSLEELYLNNNHLGEVEPDKWKNLTSLKLLNLANNYLAMFDASSDLSFSNLEQLNLSGNYLSQLGVFSLRRNLPRLKNLDIRRNNWLCEDLEVIKQNLMDSKIYLPGVIDCNPSGVYKKIPVETTTVSTSTVVATTVRKTPDYSKEILVQNGQVLFTNKRMLEYIRHLETLIVYLIVVVVIFIVVDIAARIGICRYIYSRMTGRHHGYIDGSDTEHMVLMSR